MNRTTTCLSNAKADCKYPIDGRQIYNKQYHNVNLFDEISGFDYLIRSSNTDKKHDLSKGEIVCTERVCVM